MNRHLVSLKPVENLFQEMEKLHDRVACRAHEFFARRGGAVGDPLDDWFHAEHEVAWAPPVEVSQSNGDIVVKAAVPGVPPEKIDLRVSPHEILISAKLEHQHKKEEGKVHVCEFERGELFRRVVLPEEIDPQKCHAEIKDGLLRITSKVVAPPKERKIDVTVA